MSLSNNSTSMPSLYDTSTSASSTGSRSSGFFPKSYPKPASSYYSQNSLVSAAKKASRDGRVAHSELGWAEKIVPRHRQQPMYAASEPGITWQQTNFAQSDRFKGYFNKQQSLKEQENPSSGMKGDNSKNADKFHRHQFQQSQEQHPGRGRSPDSYRNASGISDNHYSSSTERSRSLSTNRLSSNLRMEPRSQFRSETTQQRETFRSSSPLPRKQQSQALGQSMYDRSSSLAEHSSEKNVREGSAHEQLKTEGDSVGSPDPNKHVGKVTYFGRAEIETPTPTSVRDLKQRLWDPDETLHHWHSQNERLHKSQVVEPRRLGYSSPTKHSTNAEWNTPTEGRNTSTSSTRRSMSPTPSRGSKEPRGHSLLRNPRYSHAAARVASRSPSRKVSALQSASPAHTSSSMESVQSELQPRNLLKPQTKSAELYGKLKAEPEAPAASGVKAESEDTPIAATANETVASLMARISAVKRSDPAKALAQIDEILKSENVSVGAVREEVVEPTRDDNNADAKEEYQDEKQVTDAQPKHDARDSIDEQLDEDSSIAATSVSSMTNPTYQGPNVMRNEVLTFSNKPSLLQAYGSTALMGRKEWFKSSSEQETNPSPPSTISLSSKDKGRRLGESARQHSTKFPQIMPSNSGELANKIRRWDEMSAPDISGAKSDYARHPIEPPGQAPNTQVGKRRAHPWDSSTPTQSDQKNTPVANSRLTGWTKQYKPKHTAQVNVASFPTDRYFDEESNSIQAFPSEYSEDELENDSKRMEPKNHSTDQKQNPEPMSFDSTWVSVPESSFFQQFSAPARTELEAVKTNATPPSRLSMSSFDQDEGLSTPDLAFGYGRAPRQPDVSSPRPPSRLQRPEDDAHRPMQTFLPRSRDLTRDFHSLSPRAVRDGRILRQSSSEDSSTDHGADASLLSKPKSRGLRSFLPKRRILKGNAVALEKETSLSKPEIFALDVEAPPPLQSRGRRYASTQDRQRSRSLEDSRNRNPNIAIKFGRLFL